ncbi:MAG: hypothetical protein WB502_07530 [Thermoactinomyces sp.]
MYAFQSLIFFSDRFTVLYAGTICLLLRIFSELIVPPSTCMIQIYQQSDKGQVFALSNFSCTGVMQIHAGRADLLMNMLAFPLGAIAGVVIFLLCGLSWMPAVVVNQPKVA